MGAMPARAAILPLPAPRLLTRTQATAYCGMGPSADLPVTPLRVRPGKQGLRYDVRDLDRWIDSLREGSVTGAEPDPFAELDRAESLRPRRQGLRV